MVAQRKKLADRMLPADVRDLPGGSADPADLAWIAGWILRRAAKRAVAAGSEGEDADVVEQTDSAFLLLLVQQVESFVRKQPLTNESEYLLTRRDRALVATRKRLAAVFEAEKTAGRKLREDEKAWRRLVALGTGGQLPLLDNAQLRRVREFRPGKSTDTSAAKLLGLLGLGGQRKHDEAKSKLKAGQRPTAADVDDRAVLNFFLRHVIGSGPTVRDAVIRAWVEAREAELPELADPHGPDGEARRAGPDV